jgi:transcriptional regulator with XRE-family HTH domain
VDKISNIIRSIRADSRLSQMQFAEKIGMKQSAYSMLESGTNKPTLEVVRKIITQFNVSPSVFFSDEVEIINNDKNTININNKIDKNGTNPPKNTRDYMRLLLAQTKSKSVNFLDNYYKNDPVGIKTKILQDLKEKHNRRFNRELAKENEGVLDLLFLIDNLGDLIDMVAEVYADNVKNKPDPFETSQYFDIENDKVDIPPTIDYNEYKENVLNWLGNVKKYEPVLNEFYNQSGNFLKSISVPEK